jgi:thiol-disulfide isomerase/thioredoxin
LTSRRALCAALTGCLGLLACGRPAQSDLTLLFFRRSPVARVGELTWAPDPDRSRIIVFRGARPLRVLAGAATTPVAATPLGHDVLVSELTGEGVVLDTAGHLVREWQSPHPVSLYAASGARVVAARSPYRVPAFLTEPPSAPLIRVLDTLGRPLEGLGTIRPVQFITQIGNAGAIAAAGDAVYFAPMVQDEIRKYGPGGTLQWTATRGLPPRELSAPLRPPVVNIALVIGPNGRLYVLGASDTTGNRLRVDVIDTASGQVLATRQLGPSETAVALSRNDSLIALDAGSLAAAAPGVEHREAFAPPFALPTLTGDTVRSATDYSGFVRLVNFWASWCDPCREEFPHMAELAREFKERRFVIFAISDDVDRGAMLRFLRQYDPGNLVVLEGRGRMKGLYHYRGLPYTLLVDRQGRVAERIFGFGGEPEFARLRETIAKEVALP